MDELRTATPLGATSLWLRAAFAGLSIVCGIVLAIVFYEVMAWRNRDALLSYKNELFLGRADNLGRDVRDLLDRARRLTTKPCSPEDIQQLRLIAVTASYVMDVGRIRDDRIACDIVYGLSPPLRALGPPDFVSADGTAFWKTAPAYGTTELRVAAVSRGDIVAITRPGPFSELTGELGDAVVHLSHSVTGYVYSRLDRYGDRPGDGPRPVLAWPAHSQLRCHDRSRICVAIDAPAHLDPRDMPLGAALLVGALGTSTGIAAFALVEARLRSRRTLLSRLRRAIDTDQITVHYQPLVRLADRRLTGVEALARWRLADGSFVPPDLFIPLAEQNGLLPLLTALVVIRTLDDLSPVLLGEGDVYVSINIGVADLIGSRLSTWLTEECRRRGIDQGRIALEITERVTDELARVTEAVGRLRQAGFRVFLDDFGSGYSSLAYLATLPINTIKLDKLFTRSAGSSLVSSLVLREICRMVESLDLAIVFEGVETEEQAKALEALVPGAIGQGWLFGRPMPAAELYAISRG